MTLLDKIMTKLPQVPRLFQPPRPPLAMSIGEEHLSLARLSRDAPSPHVEAFFSGAVPPGALRGSATLQNVMDREVLGHLVRGAREHVAPEGGPVSLSLPDTVARVTLIPIEKLPTKRAELLELVTWRMKKTLPFRIEDARVEATDYPTPDGKHVLLAAAVRQRVLQEYENLLESAGFRVGNVTLDTLALAHALPAEQEGDTLLLNVGAGWFSIFIANDSAPVFFRCKALPEAERHGAERDWFVAGEIFPTLEYYRTRLNGTGPDRVYLHVSGPGWEALQETLATSIETPILPLALPTSGAAPSEASERLGPAASLAALSLRGRETTATPRAAAGAGA